MFGASQTITIVDECVLCVCAASKIEYKKNMREIIVNRFRFDFFQCSFALLFCIIIILPRCSCYRFSILCIWHCVHVRHNQPRILSIRFCRHLPESFIYFLFLCANRPNAHKRYNILPTFPSKCSRLSNVAARRNKFCTNRNIKARKRLYRMIFFFWTQFRFQ